MTGEVRYIEHQCPKLKKRMDEDAEKGLFRWHWATMGKESEQYFTSLIGRKIKPTELKSAVFDEIEKKL